MSGPNGIIYNASNKQRVRLPLEEVRARAVVLDVSARVTVKQIYSNPSEHPTARAKYCFPVPAGAAVCAFEMIRASDGRKIQAVAREREQARVDFERAVSAGEDAGLLEYVTDDIFTISVGSIPARDQVAVQIVYVTSLLSEESASDVRLHLPMRIAERYGKLPVGLSDATHPSTDVRVRISVDVLARGKLISVRSPSHPADLRLRPYETDRGRASRRRITAKYRSADFLDRDFVLVVRAEGLGESRCFAELGRHPTDRHLRTLALQLVLVPRVPPTPGPGSRREFIFLVDRSGSMGEDGNKPIETAKKTLEVLLLMLPAQGTYFNIFSFGGHSDSLWLRSRPYDEGTLDEAMEHIRSMRANYGGTQIREALENVFASRQESHPTSVFVLTDGSAYDRDVSIEVVRAAVSSAPSYARLNVYCLGISKSVSTDMCEGIARAGDGIFLYAQHVEGIMAKCARLFRAGRAPRVEEVSIDWGVPAEYLAPDGVVFDRPTTARGMASMDQTATTTIHQPWPTVQQSPSVIRTVHAGNRMHVFAIIALRRSFAPREVVLRMTLHQGSNGSRETVNIAVPVKEVQIKEYAGLPVVHTLGAWRLIQDLQEGRAVTMGPSAVGMGLNASWGDVKEDIIRLGETYQLASRHTSFVAVRANDGLAGEEYEEESVTETGSSVLGVTSPGYEPSSPPLGQSPEFDQDAASTRSGLRSLFGSIFPWLRRRHHSDTTEPAWDVDPTLVAPGAYPPSADGVAEDAPIDDAASQTSGTRTFTTLSSLESYYSWSSWSEHTSTPRRSRRRPALSSDDRTLARAPSPQLRFRPSPPAPPPRPCTPPPVDNLILQLVLQQAFDGSFTPDRTFRDIVGGAAVDAAEGRGVDRTVWATALAVAWLEVQMEDQGELRDDFLAKPMEVLMRRERNWRKVLEKARAVIAKREVIVL
ncbi:hypothetical protein EV122DRAFT_223607 [Schizophyllum commune]